MMGFDGDPAYYAFDNLTITTPDVPEPTSMLALFGASTLGGLSMLRRRFKA
jgi:hypothetical protein